MIPKARRHYARMNSGVPKRGFTILEVLVASAVLILVLGILLQLSSNTLQATKASQRQMEASQRARTIMDALANDLDNLILIGNQGIYVRTNGHSTELAFLTRSRGPSGTANSRALAVAYTVDGTQIIRRTAPVLWTDTDLIAAALAAATSSTESVLAEGVLSFQISFVLSSGDIEPLSGTGTWVTDTIEGTTLPDDFYALILPAANSEETFVQGLVFSLASLDAQTASLPEAADLADDLAEVVIPAGETPREAWDAATTNGLLDSYPPQMRTSFRTAQLTWQLR